MTATAVLESPSVTTTDAVDAADVTAGSGRLTRAEVTELIERNLPLVQHVLFQVAAHYPRHADREELAQAATLGLVEAAHRFDPARGVPFERWVSMRVRGAIVDAARALDFAPRSLRAAARTVEDATTPCSPASAAPRRRKRSPSRCACRSVSCFELQGRVHRALVLSPGRPLRRRGRRPADPRRRPRRDRLCRPLDPARRA